MRLIYLDYNTTTPLAGAAREAMLPFLYEFYGAPNARHWTGAAVAEALEDARSSIATLVKCDPHNVVFTSGGTESINAAIQIGWKALKSSFGSSSQMLLTTFEHAATHRAAYELANVGNNVQVLQPDRQGPWTVDAVVQAVGARPTYLALTLADGETGLIQPIAELAHRLRDTGQKSHVLLHVDCCQAVGKVEINFDDLGADFLSLSGHKMYSPKGVGALVLRSDHVASPWLCGDWYERGIRNGMPNVPGIVAMSAAAQMVSVSVERFAERCEDLFRIFENMYRQCSSTEFRSYFHRHDTIPNTRLYILEEVDVESILQRCPELCVKSMSYDQDAMNFAIEQESQNSQASAADMPRVLPISEMDAANFNSLAAAGLTASQQASSLLISLGWNTTEAEMMHAAEVLGEAFEQTRSS